MRAFLPFILALAAFQVHGQQPGHSAAKPTGTLADTVLIDPLLDSAKTWASSGEFTDLVLATTDSAMHLLDAVHAGPEAPAVLRRRLKAYKVRGMFHHFAGHYDQALDQFIHMERVAAKLGLKQEQANALTYQGYEYRNINDNAHARDVGLRALGILREMPASTSLGTTLAGLGGIYFNLGQLDSSLAMHRQAAAVYKQVGNAPYEASELVSIAEIHNSRGRYDSALHELTLARPVLMEESNPVELAVFLNHEATALFALGRLAEARHDLEAMQPLVRESENDEHSNRMLGMLALTAAAEGHYKQAVQLQDSARSALIKNLDLAKVQEITELRLKAEQERERLKADARLAEERTHSRNRLIGGVLVLCIAILLGWLLFTTRRKNAKILRAQEQVVEAEKQRETEQVRTRLARDIHDDIGSGLTKIALLGNEAKRRMQESSEELSATLDRIITHSREVSASLSDIVWTVNPEHDNSAELVSHAQNLARRMLDHSAVAHEFHFRHEEPLFDVAPGTKHHIVMVMKEAINNALKYAEAKHISVELEAGAQHFSLQVKDDGKGFDPVAMAATGNGLRNMRARAEAIGATLAMESEPGLGCTVRMEGPLT